MANRLVLAMARLLPPRIDKAGGRTANVKYLTQRYDYLSNIKLVDDRKEAGVIERSPYGPVRAA
jgi:hypothetical protein